MKLRYALGFLAALAPMIGAHGAGKDTGICAAREATAPEAAEPLIEALREVSRKLWSAPYATSSEVARRNTEKYLAGLFSQAWTFTEHVRMLATPHFSQALGVEGLPGLYNPDNLYRSALLEPGGIYRIHGRRGTHDDLSFQVIDQYPIVGLGKNLLVVRPDSDGIRPGDTFEFFIGGKPRRDGRWFALPDGARAVLVRQSFGDWKQMPSELHIERLDTPAPQSAENPFAQAATYLCQATRLWVDGYLPGIHRNTLVNALPAPRPSDTGAGGLGGQTSIMARYSIKEDEALLITVRKSDAGYQGIQLGDPWFVTPNSVEHQISLTARQAHVDDDGLIRFVIALKDPGVPNWLDAAGNPEGYIFMRWQNPRTPLGEKDAPVAQVVSLGSLRKALPSNTPVVGPEERRAQLAERRQVPQLK